MLAFIIRRLLGLVVVLFTITVVVFLLFFATPGVDPSARLAGRNPSPETVAAVKHEFGLDRSLPVRYGLMMKRLFISRDLVSYGNQALEVVPAILSAAPVTFSLVFGAAVLWVIVSIAMGIMAVTFKGTFVDPLLMILALIGISMPVFFIGPLALYVFVYKWHILPGSGYSPIGEDGVWQWFNHFILPWCVLALLYAAFYARLSRANLLDVMGEDYMRTARAKGLNERQVIVKHGLRSSLTPLVTVFGLDLAGLLAGAVITETVFNLPGLGQYAVRSVFSLDLYAILDVTVIAAFFVAIANLVVDIVYAFLDPRVRYT